MAFLDITVDGHGPVFDGTAQKEVGLFLDHVENELGDLGVTQIRAYLPTQYMYLGHHGGDPIHNPVPPNAGYLASQVHTERATTDSVLITDDPVTYGPWIEGESSLNLVVWPGRLRRGLSGRFPGYHAFRLIAQALDAEAVPTAERELPPYIEAMNA
jgi:hypothetical protein